MLAPAGDSFTSVTVSILNTSQRWKSTKTGHKLQSDQEWSQLYITKWHGEGAKGTAGDEVSTSNDLRGSEGTFVGKSEGWQIAIATLGAWVEGLKDLTLHEAGIHELRTTRDHEVDIQYE